jgi:hypothetical protein
MDRSQIKEFPLSASEWLQTAQKLAGSAVALNHDLFDQSERGGRYFVWPVYPLCNE